MRGSKNPRTLTHEGATRLLSEWAAISGVPEATIRTRIDRLGWDAGRAITTPVNKRFARSPGRPASGSPRSAPKLTKHKGGQACVSWRRDGKRHTRYFGPWGSKKARDGYARFLRDWAESVTQDRPAQVVTRAANSIAELVLHWLDHAKLKYVKLGKQTSEYHCHRSACGVLLDLFAELPIAEFGLQQIEAVRAEMIARKWARKSINIHISRIITAFGWGVPRGLVPANTHYALQQIEHLKPGTTAARESTPVRSVPVADLNAVLAGEHLDCDPVRRATLADMIRTQLLTGMRPAELCAMHPRYINREESPWRYAVPPVANKNYHREQSRVVWLGPRAREIIEPRILEALEHGGNVFTFAPMRRKALGPRAVSRLEYSRLIRAACIRAGVTPWHPHQLRHNKATDVKRLYESDSAAAHAIGTTDDVAARIYADPQEVVARRIAEETS